MKTLRWTAATVGLSLVLAGGSPSGLARADERPIHLDGAWARRAPAMAGGHGPGGATGSVYVTITNTGAAGDALVSASTDAAQAVELHETRMEGSTMRMRPVPRFELPAGGRVELKPGSFHLMLMDLKRDLKSGDTVRLHLMFEKAGDVVLDAVVR